ncbi:MAG: tRNA (N6-threonylcarbamoyladenosine(37)-N6)-methyltransferase TrmO [Ruminococcaceae bacterium]|nr:tRNA (N6-threonylcarbamoyladenosine(37)-N6)-methyltransferase TrmO [Oscillospiraceae bacterium]
MPDFLIKPVAKIKNGYNEKFGVPRQSGLAPDVKSEIVFEKEFRDENLIRDIEQYSHLWLIWGFSENNEKWSATVRPPKLGGNKRVGVFATRSPYRPNSLGLSVVRLEEIKNSKDGKILVVSGADLVNATPIFDIKPYLPYADSIPTAKGGFSEEYKNDFLNVTILKEAEAVVPAEELEEIKEILSLNPRPAYQNDEERVYGLSYKNSEVKFKYCESGILIIGIG